MFAFVPSGFASASQICQNLFRSQQASVFHLPSHQEPDALIESLYEESRFLGLAVADHSSASPVLYLKRLLEKRGLDPELKVLVLEISTELGDLYKLMSTQDLSVDEFKKAAPSVWSGLLEDSPQDALIFAEILPLVRTLNAQRPLDPIVIIPIDSIASASINERILRPGEVACIECDLLPDDSTPWHFVVSIDREKETAANFQRLVYDRFPGRKGIIHYHQAHILRDLIGFGVTRENDHVFSRDQELGWINFAFDRLTSFRSEYRVVTFDHTSIHNPFGIFSLPNGARVGGERNGFDARALRWLLSANMFAPNTFLSRYRQSSIRPLDHLANSMDGLIIESRTK